MKIKYSNNAARKAFMKLTDPNQKVEMVLDTSLPNGVCVVLTEPAARCGAESLESLAELKPRPRNSERKIIRFPAENKGEK